MTNKLFRLEARLKHGPTHDLTFVGAAMFIFMQRDFYLSHA